MGQLDDQVDNTYINSKYYVPAEKPQANYAQSLGVSLNATDREVDSKEYLLKGQFEDHIDEKNKEHYKFKAYGL